MNKNWIVAGLWMLLLTACSTQQEDTQGIIGDENGVPLALTVQSDILPDGHIQLHKFDGEQRVLLDSFQMKESPYTQNIAIASPAYYTVTFPEGAVVSFVMNDAPVTISMSQGGDYSVEGGKDNELHQEFMVLNTELNQQAQSLRMQAMQAKTPEEQQYGEEQFQLFVENAKAKVMDFINRAEESIVVVSAMSMLDPDEDIETMRHVSEKLSAKYPDAKIAQTLAEQVASLGKLSVGAVAPDFTLSTSKGEQIKLSSLRGQYVMIDFWASWCGPCRKENPKVVQVYKEYADKGFQILGVSVDKDAQAWEKAIDKDGLPWLHVLDEESSVAEIYNVTGIPFTVLLDQEGKILAKGLRSEGLRQELKKLL